MEFFDAKCQKLDIHALEPGIYRSFPILFQCYFNIVQGMTRWNGYPARMNFLFLFFPTQSATTSLSPISNNFPSTHSTILQYFFFSQYKWNVHIYTHTQSRILDLPQRDSKKRKKKKKTQIPRGAADSILPLSKGCHNARRCKPRSRPARGAFRFYHFPAHVRRNKRNPGNLFRRSCRFFPHPPRPLSHDTRPHAQLFPAINIIIYRSSRGSWSIRVTVLYINI